MNTNWGFKALSNKKLSHKCLDRRPPSSNVLSSVDKDFQKHRVKL